MINITYVALTKNMADTCVRLIEIINNTRGDIEGKIWERGYWGANSSPGCSLIHDVPGKKVILDEFFCFLNAFPRKNIGNIISDCLK